MSMDSKVIKIGKAQLRAKSSYERFMISEGVPVIGGFGVNSVRDIPMTPWRRLGCDGAYFKFFGSDGVTGYVRREDRRPAARLCRSAICTKKSSIFSKAKASPNFSNAITCRRIFSGNRAVCFRRR